MTRHDKLSLTAEELAVLAAKGDDDAMARLIVLISPIARARAAALGGKNASTEDLVQEGMVGFLYAVRTFSPAKCASFRTYANTCISNRIISALRSSHSGKNSVLSDAVPLTDDASPAAASPCDPQDILSSKEESVRLMKLLSSELSDFELSVLRLRFGGDSYNSIARQLSCTEKAVDNALQRVKAKLRSKM